MTIVRAGIRKVMDKDWLADYAAPATLSVVWLELLLK